jgi:hypothetical protein
MAITSWFRRGAASLLAAAALVSGAFAQTAAAPASGAADEAVAKSAAQSQAHDLLMRMARYLAEAKLFAVSLEDSYDAVQESGQKIEFGDRRKMVIERPARLLVEAERSDGVRTATVLNGKEIVVTDFVNNVYASMPQPGELDDSIVYLVRDFGIRLPLALLFTTRAPQEIEARVRSVDYVEKTNLLGTPAHHLVATGDTVDFQVWVADGERPLPLSIVITYKTEPGQPQFRARFKDWDMAPAVTDATFAPRLPQGAQKIAFAAQLANRSPEAAKSARGAKP